MIALNIIALQTSKVGDETIQTANARDLHAFLEIGKTFAAWIIDRIEQYGFVEGEDYVVFSDSGKNPQGGRPAKEYHITIDMAKELSMVERNAKGKAARRYFIECERAMKSGGETASISAHADYVATLSADFKTFREAGMSENMSLFVANSLAAQKTGIAPLPNYPVALPNPTRTLPGRIATPLNEGDALQLLLSMKRGESINIDNYDEFGYSSVDAMRRSIRAFAKRHGISVGTILSPNGLLISIA